MAIAATAVWRVRPGGNNANGGGFDAAISGAGTDYSQQDAAQASGTAGTASGTTAFSDAAGLFTAAMVGNAIRIASGAGFTAGWYFVTGYTSATAVTLDRSPGTGSAAVWALGGAWADFWINPQPSNAAVVAGNTVYILGSGIPNPAGYTYDYTVSSGTYGATGSTSGVIRFLADPATPNYAAGGMPCVKFAVGNALFYNSKYVVVSKIYFVAYVVANPMIGGTSFSSFIGCVFDQFGNDVSVVRATLLNCEVFSSASASPGSQYALNLTTNEADRAVMCNVHNTVGHGIVGCQGVQVISCIVAKCGGDGITLSAGGYQYAFLFMGNTVDGNLGNGIVLDQTNSSSLSMFNNVISNHVAAGKYGVKMSAGTAAQNDLIVEYRDRNTFYNNTNNYSGLSAGPTDTFLATDPYVDSVHNDYTPK